MTGDPTTVQKLVQEHFQKTNSDLAAKLLADWESHSACFWKIVPQPPAALADRATRRFRSLSVRSYSTSPGSFIFRNNPASFCETRTTVSLPA